jgi:hypothetical protein
VLFSPAIRRLHSIDVVRLGRSKFSKPRGPLGSLGFFFALQASEKPLKTTVISVRFSARLVAHLDTLCEASLQKRADIVRLLIAKARLEDLPQAWRDLSADERKLLQESR